MALGFSLIFALGCENGEKDEEKAEAEAASVTRKVPVEAVEVVERDIRDTLESTAAVDARQAVDIVAVVPGVVVSLDVEQGDTVKKGERLAKIQREELNLGVQAASSAVGRLQQEVDRLKPLLDKGVISRQMYDEARYRLEEARGEQRRARVAVGDTRVTTPMDGVVAMRAVNLGQQVATGTPLFRVVDPAELIVVVNLPETALGDVFEGQSSYITSEALDDARFPATVERISPVVDPRTGTIRVTLRIDEAEDVITEEEKQPEEAAPPARQLRPGMFVKTYIVTSERENALVVPRRAVTYLDDRAMIFVVESGVAIRKPVVTGIAEGSLIELREGVSSGDSVIVLGQDGLKDGTPVDVEMRSLEAR